MLLMHFAAAHLAAVAEFRGRYNEDFENITKLWREREREMVKKMWFVKDNEWRISGNQILECVKWV